MLKRLLKPKIVILDDVGKQSTPESVDMLSTLVNDRINEGRKTICTTNSALNSEAGLAEFLSAVDARTYARYEDQLLEVTGPDFRKGR